ncbi:uncharacterized protein N7443_003261 [Penicillium atrosanguineum]|uniref:N-acetyltransferase domain-containing protein n=1 Tax=Penicillium atrosanguineum TaxID=1132637 RepID=A0A9W9U5L7_9EURO|nr:uncharacterized protein N7443_003261 [Penicillium atrosanguineum]KAJ5118057.1 hypothetical protein N7526_011080 [Penicillium atrosanguineum]KAJ5310800.1 hypothetical protein N7443_003261 [Penicillium atrosanguineum]KAJ5316324.1 hypothetical protein N7476_006631 [Penicillium atrosanguineum]
MAFEVEPAHTSDAPQMARVFQAAFSDAFNRKMLPPTEDVNVWAIENVAGGGGAQPHEVFLKICDDEGRVAAFAKWVQPVDTDDGRHENDDNQGSWPVSADKELCEVFFGTMSEHHRELMGTRRHYYLEILAVDPAYQGRGLASKLLKWGLARADEEGVEVYLSSSPEGRKVYEKYGFESRHAFSPFPAYEQLNMIRPIQR